MLTQLLSSKDPNIKELILTAVVRRQDQADVLSKTGVRTELFKSLDDTEHLRRLASEHDIVFHCATGLHTASAEALVLGLGDSMKKTGRQTFYIHVSLDLRLERLETPSDN